MSSKLEQTLGLSDPDQTRLEAGPIWLLQILEVPEGTIAVSVKRVARMLELSPSKVYSLIDDGELQVLRLGSSTRPAVRILTSSLETFINQAFERGRSSALDDETTKSKWLNE